MNHHFRLLIGLGVQNNVKIWKEIGRIGTCITFCGNMGGGGVVAVVDVVVVEVIVLIA